MEKRIYHLGDFAVPADHWVKNEKKQKDKRILGSCLRAEKSVEHKSVGNTTGNWQTWNNPQRLVKKDWWDWKFGEDLRPSRAWHC